MRYLETREVIAFSMTMPSHNRIGWRISGDFGEQAQELEVKSSLSPQPRPRWPDQVGKFWSHLHQAIPNRRQIWWKFPGGNWSARKYALMEIGGFAVATAGGPVLGWKVIARSSFSAWDMKSC
jgi:hypothetical protein